MRRQSLKSRKQTGDTIVEVLIAIAIIAAILAGAFLLARNSLKQVRDSEERAQATNLIQGQIEQLRSLATSTNTADKNTAKSGTPFCLDGATVASAATCDSMGDSGIYRVELQKTGQTNFGTYKTYNFEATVEWDSISGGTSRVQLFYHAAID